MKRNKKFIAVTSLILVIAVISFLWWRNNRQGYIIVTEDRRNFCGYDADGRIVNSTLATGEDVEVKVPKHEYEQYKKDAISSGKCFR